MRLKLRSIVKDVFWRSIDDDIIAHGAQMAYYLVLSFFPFLIFFLTILSYTSITSEAAVLNLKSYLPADIFVIVQGIIKQMLANRSGTLLSFGVIATFWVATNAMEAMIKGIKTAYGLKDTRPYWRFKLAALFYTIAITMVFMFSLIMVVFGQVIADKIAQLFPSSSYLLSLWSLYRYVVPAITMMTVFMIVYHYIPGIRHSSKDIWPGALFSTIGWIVIAEIFSYYVNHMVTYASTYGGIGGAFAMLVWIYWCSIVILLGSEINSAIYFYRYGSRGVSCPVKPHMNLKHPIKILFPKKINGKGYFESRLRIIKTLSKQGKK